LLARMTGVFGEPAGVAGVAGVRRAVESSVIDRSESVAIVMTGNGLKDVRSAMRAVGGAIHVRRDIENIRKAIEVAVTA